MSVFRLNYSHLYCFQVINKITSFNMIFDITFLNHERKKSHRNEIGIAEKCGSDGRHCMPEFLSDPILVWSLSFISLVLFCCSVFLMSLLSRLFKISSWPNDCIQLFLNGYVSAIYFLHIHTPLGFSFRNK